MDFIDDEKPLNDDDILAVLDDDVFPGGYDDMEEEDAIPNIGLKTEDDEELVDPLLEDAI